MMSTDQSILHATALAACACIKTYKPVCGASGITYSNAVSCMHMTACMHGMLHACPPACSTSPSVHSQRKLGKHCPSTHI